MLDLSYYADKITVLNPAGHTAILTLWSRVDISIKKLGGLENMPSHVCAISPFYGDGISQLLANLLANPQIRTLHVAGTNRSGSLQELQAFFAAGVEEVNVHGVTQRRIRGTTRLINPAITGPDLFENFPPAIIAHDSFEALRAALDGEISPPPPLRLPKRLVLVEPQPDVLPSIQGAHQIVSEDILDAWRELLFILHRFGEPTVLAKGKRRELYNVRVVIQKPRWAADADYQSFNLDPGRLRLYADQLLLGELSDDTSYTYGHRLRSYFGFDALERVVQRLVADPCDRKCYVSLWDPYHDLELMDTAASHPCWVGGFFRLLDGQLTLSCTFRTHRAYTAWVENAHSLLAVMGYVASRLGSLLNSWVGVGALTITSHAISIDPVHLPEVEGIIAGRRWRLRGDGRGDLVFALQEGKIVVEHRLGGLLLKRYSHHNAEVLSHQLSQDQVVADLGHALYVGRQLGKLQMCLQHKLPYEEA